MRPLAGGTDLLLELARSGRTEPQAVVDLTGISELSEVTDDGLVLRIGSGVTHAQVVADPRFVNSALPLAQACLEVGSPQLRNRATIAGNLASASPANDTISALMALGAIAELVSLGSDETVRTRMVPVDQFFSGFRQTVLAPGELIAALHVPKLGDHERGMWMKVGLRKNQAISVVHAGIVIATDGQDVRTARLALGSVGPTVALIPAFADALEGAKLDDGSIHRASVAAAEAIEPITDGRGTADYRRRVVSTIVRRGLRALAEGTQAAMWPEAPPTLSRSTSDRPAPVRPVITDASLIDVRVNAQSVSAANSAGQTLLDWLRNDASRASGRPLSGVKEGCAEGECGACTVTLNGQAVMSCLVSAAQTDGGSVVTVEGLNAEGLNVEGPSQADELHAVQEAFVDEFAVQCGYCIPGFIMAASHLLDEIAEPTDEQIEHALSGNLCRCTGYYPMYEAITRAARLRQDRGVT